MHLINVHFDAYRSLIDASLSFEHGCCTLVGINESGKTNVLRALALLSEENDLRLNDAPKIDKRNPKVRFLFELDDEETRNIKENLQLDSNDADGVWPEKLQVECTVQYDEATKQKKRSFAFTNLVAGSCLYLKNEYTNDDGLTVWNGAEFKSFRDVPLIDENLIETNLKMMGSAKNAYEIEQELLEIDEELGQYNESLQELETKLENASAEIENIELSDKINSTEDSESVTKEKSPEVSESSQSATAVGEQHDEAALKSAIKQLRRSIAKLGSSREKKQVQMQSEQAAAENASWYSDLENERSKVDYGFKHALPTDKQKLSELSSLLKSQIESEAAASIEAPVAAVAAVDVENDADTKEVIQQNISALEIKIEERTRLYREAENDILSLELPVNVRYSADQNEFGRMLGEKFGAELVSYLPGVVWWEHSSEFILAGEIELNEILDGRGAEEIPRPLINLLRVGVGNSEWDELKKQLLDTVEDSSERPRLEARINKNVSEYIERVWPTYKQKLRISLEKERMLIKLYDPDPKHHEPSFFQMEERSQGAQTFLSFLFTIAAETQFDLISNTLLLLDEPETHLHPSGVRYMLDRLIETSKKNNYVVLATHSIFMIDRNCFDRHIVVEKNLEITKLNSSERGRIGCFMHEEILYKSLHVDLANEFSEEYKYNFVFEGVGDAVLFQSFFKHSLKNGSDLKMKDSDCYFYHGGKCSDMIDHFKSYPVPLGSKWYFVIDSDEAGNSLRKFLESKFKDYIEKDIFIRQYCLPAEDAHCELECLLPGQIIGGAIDAAKSYSQLRRYKFPDRVEENYNFDEYLSLLKSSKHTAASITAFKKHFKSALNAAIIEAESKITSNNEFKTEFEAYHCWAGDAVKNISA